MLSTGLTPDPGQGLNHGIKVIIASFIMRYKRNQVEEAIVRTLGAEDARVNELKLKMKRLLVTDRRLGRGKRSDVKVGRRYAFYGQKPQGSGVEVMFSGYEAFALLAALVVLEHGIPQAKVVSILREIRFDLRPPIATFCRKTQRGCSISSPFEQWRARGDVRRRQYGAGVSGICEARYRERESARMSLQFAEALITWESF